MGAHNRDRKIQKDSPCPICRKRCKSDEGVSDKIHWSSGGEYNIRYSVSHAKLFLKITM